MEGSLFRRLVRSGLQGARAYGSPIPFHSSRGSVSAVPTSDAPAVQEQAPHELRALDSTRISAMVSPPPWGASCWCGRGPRSAPCGLPASTGTMSGRPLVCVSPGPGTPPPSTTGTSRGIGAGTSRRPTSPTGGGSSAIRLEFGSGGSSSNPSRRCTSDAGPWWCAGDTRTPSCSTQTLQFSRRARKGRQGLLGFPRNSLGASRKDSGHILPSAMAHPGSACVLGDLGVKHPSSDWILMACDPRTPWPWPRPKQPTSETST